MNNKTSAAKPGLIRSLGPWSAAAIVAGSAIGSGIFLVASDITRQLPTPGLALLVWVAAGTISLIGGLALAELGAIFPGSGGQYVFLKECFGPLPGFLYGWTLALVIQPGSIAAVSIAFAQYTSAMFPMPPDAVKATAMAAIIALTGINLLGVRRGAGVQNILTSIKVLTLIAIAMAGFIVPVQPGAGLTQAFTGGSVFASNAGGMTAFGVALIAAFWAFDGWNNVTFIAGEIKEPRRNVPLSLFIGLSTVAILYLLVNMAYYRMLPAAAVAGSSFPAADAVRIMGGEWWVRAIIIAVVISTLGCVNGMVLAGARVTYAMADAGSLPRKLAYVHPRFHVPSVTLLIQMAWAVLLVWSGRYDQLFTYVISAAFLFYGLTVAGLIVLRRRAPQLERPYKVPFYPWLPLVYLVFTAAFLINSVAEKPRESLAGLVIVCIGIPVFYALRRKRR